MNELFEAYSRHEQFIRDYWQTRLPEVDDLSAMYLGLAEEIGEFQEEFEKENPDAEEVKSELSDILFYITGILIELPKQGYGITFQDVYNCMSDDSMSGNISTIVFKMLSMYNKSIRKRQKMDETKLAQLIFDAYINVENISNHSLAEVLDYNVEKLSGRDTSGQNGTVA